MNSPVSTPNKPPRRSASSRRQLLILIIISGAILLLIAVTILVYLGLRGTGQPPASNPTPTEALEEPAATASPIPVANCETIVTSGDAQVSLAFPVSLTVSGVVYPVEPIVPQENAWSYPADRSGTAVWVCGSVVNYVIGLEPTTANSELLSSLAPGDDLTIELTSGAELQFRFAERRDTAPGSDDAITQQQPRLTLVLPGMETWQVTFADYAADAEPVVPPPSGQLAEVGQAVDVGQVRVVVNQGYLERNADLVPSTAYYLIEFRVENLGSQPLAAGRFAMELRDSLGNVYLVSPEASRIGEAGPLGGEIAPGESRLATAGYLVPDPLSAGDLTWVFSPRSIAATARVRIPHEGGAPQDEAPIQPEVNLVDAFLGDDGDTLILEGEVWNRDTERLVVESDDVSLSSSAGVSELTASAPPLPWTVEPGARQVVELQYLRPDASTVLLELLGYSFEIGGLD